MVLGRCSRVGVRAKPKSFRVEDDFWRGISMHMYTDICRDFVSVAI